MSTMIAYHSDTALDAILDTIKDWVGEQLHKNLQIFAKQGLIKLELPEANLDKEMWDGTLLIHFVNLWSATDIINYIVSVSRADEISMLNDKTLRLWWD
jgi:hypothetical protein